MEIVIAVFLALLGLYFLGGLLFACYTVFFGALKLDPLLGNSQKRVRLLLFPGLVATWPFLLKKLLKRSTE